MPESKAPRGEKTERLQMKKEMIIIITRMCIREESYCGSSQIKSQTSLFSFYLETSGKKEGDVFEKRQKKDAGDEKSLLTITCGRKYTSREKEKDPQLNGGRRRREPYLYQLLQ
jgi:hypothetical protein